MEHTEGSVSQAGATRAIVTVLRALLDAQQDQDATWQRLRAQYRQATAQLAADPSLQGERSAFEEVFDMLGIEGLEGSGVAGDIRRTGRPPDSATANPTDGVDDASMY